jgi:amino acid transporter
MVRRQLSGDLKHAKKQTLSVYNLEQHKGSMEHSLRKGALGLLDTTVMAVAGSAPAYSITASTAALVAAVGIAGPAALLIAFLPMIGITIAFSYLNLWRSDAGAAYAWVGRTIHPALGFIAGWALLSLSTIFMVAAALPAGEATLDLARRASFTTYFGRLQSVPFGSLACLRSSPAVSPRPPKYRSC